MALLIYPLPEGKGWWVWTKKGKKGARAKIKAAMWISVINGMLTHQLAAVMQHAIAGMPIKSLGFQVLRAGSRKRKREKGKDRKRQARSAKWLVAATI